MRRFNVGDRVVVRDSVGNAYQKKGIITAVKPSVYAKTPADTTLDQYRVEFRGDHQDWFSDGQLEHDREDRQK